MTDNRDNLFQRRDTKSGSFEFDAQVADVFPDMIRRSVPGYQSILQHLPILAKTYTQTGSVCYDLGCSLGAASVALANGAVDGVVAINAIDKSPDMVRRCRMILERHPQQVPINVLEQDLLEVDIHNASMVVMNFTLQFIALERRQELLGNIYSGLNDSGALVLSEKIGMPDDGEDAVISGLHESFKRDNGYSELEIAAKRTALENVLIPESMQTHQNRLRALGFSEVICWFRCLNFVSFLAIK